MGVTQTARMLLTRWSDPADPLTRAQMDDDHAQLEARAAGFLRDTLANRPAAAAANLGFIYEATDTGEMFWSTGAAWLNLGGIAPNLVDAKGDLLVGMADNTVAKKTVGANGSLLVADSAQADGLRYAEPVVASVATEETTTSTTYTDLATAGPAVSADIGASGKALVILSAETYTSQLNQYTRMSFAVSGATTLAADDARSLNFRSASSSGQVVQLSRALLLTGLNAGATTFTTKYRASVAATTNAWGLRSIIVIPL